MIGFHPFGPLPALAGPGGFAAADRLRVSVFASALIHMVVILGLSFTFPKLRDLQGLPTLEITLVQTRSDVTPKEAEFLANASQDGGGQSDRPDIARNPLPVREVSDRNRPLVMRQTPPQQKVEGARETTSVLSWLHADWRTFQIDPKPERRDPQPLPPNLALNEPDVQRAERARLNAEIARSWQELQQRPRRKFLNARTQEYKYAVYLDAWRAKIERVGNINYPPEAKRRGLTGNLLVDVALRHDGSVESIAVRRSSGHKIIDDAAVRIVELSSPFAPFTPEMRAETDILHITRTWKFNETFSSEN